MKEIKITQASTAKIEAALALVNGTAVSHTYSRFDQIEALIVDAEKRLTNLLVAKKYFVGARFNATSGYAVGNAYKYSRDATSVTLTRKSSGWFLTDAVSTKIYKDGGKKILRLTEGQDAIVYKVVRTNYKVQS